MPDKNQILCTLYAGIHVDKNREGNKGHFFLLRKVIICNNFVIDPVSMSSFGFDLKSIMNNECWCAQWSLAFSALKLISKQWVHQANGETSRLSSIAVLCTQTTCTVLLVVLSAVRLIFYWSIYSWWPQQQIWLPVMQRRTSETQPLLLQTLSCLCPHWKKKCKGIPLKFHAIQNLYIKPEI